MIPFTPLELWAAWALDGLFGDPRIFTRVHPVVVTGKLIRGLEKLLYGPNSSPASQILRGAVLWFATVGAVFGISFGVLAWLAGIDPLWARIAGTAVAFTTIATRDLDTHVRRVLKEVEGGRLEGARRELSMIVGRDTENLPEPEIMRAAFETTAENSSDGVVAPLFYLALGAALGLGPVLGLAYKAVNTLDSMVGYRNEKYLYFGRFSARADDLFNYLPARLTAFSVALVSAVLFQSGLNSLKIALRDARLHASPNSGWAEAAYAGAVGVRIGGSNFYGGIERKAPLIGEPDSPLDISAVKKALALTWSISLLSLAALSAPLFPLLIKSP